MTSNTRSPVRITLLLTSLCTSLLVMAGPSAGRAQAADVAEDAVLAPGTLENHRPRRRLVGRKLAVDSPLAPGSVKSSKSTTAASAPRDGEAVLAPASIAPGSADRPAKRSARKR